MIPASDYIQETEERTTQSRPRLSRSSRTPEAGARLLPTSACSTSRLQNQGNKARMCMKTKRLFDGLRRAADCKNSSQRYQNRGNKARMCMKTKDRLRNQPPLAPPYLRRGIPGSPPRMRRGGGGASLWPLDRLARWRETGIRKNEGTKPECV